MGRCRRFHFWIAYDAFQKPFSFYQVFRKITDMVDWRVDQLLWWRFKVASYFRCCTLEQIPGYETTTEQHHLLTVCMCFSYDFGWQNSCQECPHLFWAYAGALYWQKLHVCTGLAFISEAISEHFDSWISFWAQNIMSEVALNFQGTNPGTSLMVQRALICFC